MALEVGVHSYMWLFTFVVDERTLKFSYSLALAAFQVLSSLGARWMLSDSADREHSRHYRDSTGQGRLDGSVG